MSWIQENRFAAGLGGITALAGIGLIAWGISESSRFEAAQAEYVTNSEAISSMEDSRLFPSDENTMAKNVALREYRDNVEKLQTAFNTWRPADLPQMEPVAFTEELKRVRAETGKLLSDAKVEFPENFFLGFESYTTRAVGSKEATGILGYQLGAIAGLFNGLAEAKIHRVVNVYRQPLEEETGARFDSKDKSVRALPLEIVFTGTEDSLRSFLTFLGSSQKYYYVVRTMRVKNEVDKAPTAADAQFTTPEEAAGSAESDSGGGFELPPEPGQETPGAGAPAEAAGDQSQILMPVLGSEKVHVFMRIDILQFLAAKELPKP